MLQSVPDEGGRDVLKSIVVDLQSSSKDFGPKAHRLLEKISIGAEQCRAVTPQALAIPTNKPLDSFDARTYPATWPEFWYGDGAPNLERDRPMLYEEVARRLLDLEELEYYLDSDDEVYDANEQSRFDIPEIVAVLGDCVRRLALLKGTKAAVGRKKIDGDLKALEEASVEDFMVALNIAKPRESIGWPQLESVRTNQKYTCGFVEHC